MPASDRSGDDDADQAPILTLGHLRLRRCRHGVMLYNLNDVYAGTMLDRYGEFSEGETEAFRQMLRPGMTAIEVGANIGAHTVFLARQVGPTGRVIAFEPQRAIFQLLCANLALNGLDHAEAHWAAAGSTPGHIMVPRLDPRQKANFGGLSLGDAQHGDKVPVVTLDSLDLPACRLIKIDVEGMEAEVLNGARATIARLRPAIYVENDRAEKSPGLIALLLELGYRCYWHTPPYVTVPNYRGETENTFHNIASVNLLCLPREAEASVDLREVSGPDDSWMRRPAPG